MSALQRLADLGEELPPVPEPAAAYVPVATTDALVFTAGQLPIVDGSLAMTGKVGEDVELDEAVDLARRAALNVLAVAASVADGDLDRIRVVKLTVFVACAPDFTSQHLVANGASDLVGEVLGEHGVHARSAVGVASLPLDAPVEVEAVLEVVGA